MRTDPRADDVRQIVHRIFSGYLRQPTAVGACAPTKEEGFPRLHRPHDDGPPFPWQDDDPETTAVEIDERIIIDEGRYVARTYRTEGYMAMWLLAAGIVQFYDKRGRMLATIDLFHALRPQAMAA